jgi:hypothetical protein
VATTQLVIVTPVPAGLQLDPDTIRVSVLFSPRLSGDDTLGAFPDWLRWTRKLADDGLQIRFECDGATLDVAADTSRLRPDLWETLFRRDTYVRSYVFDDYSDRFVPSYSNRLALGLVQSAYQQAAVDLAVPPMGDDDRETLYVQRGRLESLLDDFAVQWDSRTGPEMRSRSRQRQERVRHLLQSTTVAGSAPGAAALDASGLIPTGALRPGTAAYKSAAATVMEDFSVFAHQPQGAEVTEHSLDREHVLDFHQALSSVHAYHQLQRDLGLVFDLELPRDFVADASNPAGELAITGVDVHWDTDIATQVPPTKVAYLHTSIGAEHRIFAVAPLAAAGPRPLLLGLLGLVPRFFGIAQVDLDGALHKTLLHAGNLDQLPGESLLPTADINDPYTALSALRSGGMSLFADSRALVMRNTFDRGKRQNADLEAGQPQQEAFHAEDLTRGYRLDVWDSVTEQWHSLHRRDMTVNVGDDGLTVETPDDEGFFQAAMTQAAPNADGTRENTDLHLHEAIVRWSGWSLSAPSVGTHLTRAGDPDKALPDPDMPDPENEPVTPFQLTADVSHVKGSLPRLRFGVGYRLRVRAVDLATNGLELDDEECRLFTPLFSMPAGDGMIPYLRYEPVIQPVLVARDVAAVADGSRVDRMVIRTFNDSADKDTQAASAEPSASDRHIAPPGIPVEMAERHGMLDDAAGKLNASAAMRQLVGDRDKGAFDSVEVPGMEIDGEPQSIPVDPAEQVATLPYLPDPLARAAAFRDLPGTKGDAIGRVAPGAGAAAEIAYTPLDDPQPRPGTATIVEYGGRDDWQQVLPFRLAVTDGDGRPAWDPNERVLTVALPKGTTHVVPMSSCCDADDLKTLGIWAWLREYVEHVTTSGDGVESAFAESPAARDRLAHVLQLAAEGGHRMITPPRLLTLVSAVQQPIGHPVFSRMTAQLRLAPTEDEPVATDLRTESETSPTAATEEAVLTGWREPGGTDAYLVGALQVHGASTAKIDLRAEWTDPYDDPVADPDRNVKERQSSTAVDQIPLPDPRPRRFWWTDNTLYEPGGSRAVGHYVREHDLIAFAPAGSRLGNLPEGEGVDEDAVPRHRIGDTRHHVVTYTAVATSRYAEYFPAEKDGEKLDFNRTSEPVVVDIPASARPVAPLVRYVVPTFGWERAGTANQVRSVRTGGGLRVYLDRPWWSSGAGELLGVTLANRTDIDRELWKGSITQWGEDPLWASSPLRAFPSISSFPDAVISERNLSLETVDHLSVPFAEFGISRHVDVAGHAVAWDEQRKLWYCDLRIDTDSPTYAPFVRLALARYQPHALEDAKLSPVVLADFAQLTAERALTVTGDPFTSQTLEVTVSGPGPTVPRRTRIHVTVQRQDPDLDGHETDLGWETAAGVTITDTGADPLDAPPPEFVLWHGRVALSDDAASGEGRYRLLVEEFEAYRVDPVGLPAAAALGPRLGERLVYAETVPLDAALLARPTYPASSTTV